MRWTARLVALLTICFVALSACVARNDGPASGANDQASGPESGTGGTTGATAKCKQGDTHACHITLGQITTSKGNVLQCFVGTQQCVEGAWGACGDGKTIEKVPNDAPAGDGKPLSFTAQIKCDDNPCDPNCSKWKESDATFGKADGTGCTWPWSWSNDPTDSIAKAKAGGAFKEPCVSGQDCQQDFKCQDPAKGTCSHDICSTGIGLIKGCETKCVDTICTNLPKCCKKDYNGTCEVEPCKTYGSGLTKTCDPDVTSTCNWDITCCPYTQWETCYFWGILFYQTVCGWVNTYVCGWQWVYICGWQWFYVCGWQWFYVCGWQWQYVCGWQWQYVCGWFWYCDWWWCYLSYSCWWQLTYVCWWQLVYTCWWELRYVCWWELRYVCWWDLQYSCWWQLEYQCWLEPVYGWVPYACQKSYPGLWDQHCVDHMNVIAPSKCPMSWAGNWDQTCINAVHDTCHDFCDGVSPMAGKCVQWGFTKYDSKCAKYDLGVGLTCNNGKNNVIPICNHGSTDAPAGIPIAIMPKSSGYFGTTPASLPGASYCFTADVIPPGECRNVTTCTVADGQEVMVNPPTAAAFDKNECGNGGYEDNWGFFYNKTCTTPPGCPGSYVKTVKIDNFTTTCAKGTTPQWTYLSWNADVPAGTSISFRVRTGDDAAKLAAAPWYTVTTTATPAAPNCSAAGPAPCPIDLFKLLGVNYGHQDQLDLEVTYNPTADQLTTPTLKDWTVAYTCLDNE